MSRPRVLVVVGFFDWFSGYQEIGLVRALAERADVRVLTGDHVNPLFSDSHLAALGMGRTYEPGRRTEHGVEILRLSVRELRSMVWSNRAPSAVTAADADLVVQVMPGQVLPLAATLSRTRSPRTILYGDNAAMYAALPRSVQVLKRMVFSATKGLLYTLANARASDLFAYTPDTVQRLRPFALGKQMALLPLAFDEAVFRVDPRARDTVRAKLGVEPSDLVIIAPGKVQSQKRLETVVDAAERLADDGRRPFVVFAGVDNSAAGSSLRERVARSALRHRIHLLPFVDASSLAALFNGADVGAWPAMPAITIQQAMGTGLPVCIPRNDYTSHLLRTEHSGVWIEGQGDLAGDLAVAIRRASSEATPLDRSQRARASRWLSTSALADRILDRLDSEGVTRD